MLLAFGVSLRLDPLLGRESTPAGSRARARRSRSSCTRRLPGRLGHLGVRADPAPEVLAVTVIAALPTAQNIYVISGRYHVRTLLSRDAIFISTIASIPVIVVASTWLR